MKPIDDIKCNCKNEEHCIHRQRSDMESSGPQRSEATTGPLLGIVCIALLGSFALAERFPIFAFIGFFLSIVLLCIMVRDFRAMDWGSD